MADSVTSSNIQDTMQSRDSYMATQARGRLNHVVVTPAPPTMWVGQQKPVARKAESGEVKADEVFEEEVIYPKYGSMTYQERTQIYYHSRKVKIYVARPGQQPLSMNMQISLDMLTSLCSAAETSVNNFAGSKDDIEHVVLPTGDIVAYKFVLAWMHLIGKRRDGTVRYKHVFAPLTIYHLTLDILFALNATPLFEDLLARYHKLKEYVPGQMFKVEPGDIQAMYTRMNKEHVLRKKLLKNLGQAYVAGDIGTKTYKELSKLEDELPDFWKDWTDEIFVAEYPNLASATQ